MDSPGKHLKQERELRNLSLDEVCKSTRVKEHFLKAMEEDRFDLCPPPFYVKGFLANYARYLGLDPRDILLKYQEWMKPPLPSPEVQAGWSLLPGSVIMRILLTMHEFKA